MKKKKIPLIVVLGGTFGVGKTTLAHQLGIDLQIMHQLGLSAITKTLSTFPPKNSVIKKWYKLDQKDTECVISRFKMKASIMGKIINNIIEHAIYTGENYIIDGTVLLPEFLPMDKILFFLISVPGSEHKKRFTNPTITRLRPSIGTSYAFAKKVSKLIRSECAGYPVYEINNIGDYKKISKQIIQTIKKIYPNYSEKYLWFRENN